VLWRQDRAVRVRVVGVWARGQRHPWGLATDLAAPLAELVALYERRLTGEEQFRATKGGRFGVRLEWTPCRTPAYLARFTLWVGVALVRWTAVGQAGATASPNVRLPGKHKGPRLSRLRLGIQCVTKLALVVSMGGASSGPTCPRPSSAIALGCTPSRASHESDQRSGP
jgi:hypothetical protein